VKNTHRAGRVGLLALSSAAATIAVLSGCSSEGQGNETSVPATTPVSSTPASTSPPSVGPSTSVAPSTTGQAPASNAPATQSEGGGPSQTVSGGNSAPQTTVRTPSPPTGDSLPGDDAGPQGNPGSPGRN
jgi:hypothetical protein